MPEKKDNIIPKVTWNQICKLAKGNPLIAIWVVALWLIVSNPRSTFVLLMLIIGRLLCPESFFCTAVTGAIIQSLKLLLKNL